MLLDFLFPKTCLGCNKLGTYICLNCERGLKNITRDTCLYCHKETVSGETHINCRKYCVIDGVLSLVEYKKEARQAIKKLKYRLLTDAFEEFFKVLTPIMIQKLVEFKHKHSNALLQPIPLHPSRMKMRGFNQSEIYARYLNQTFSFPVVDVIRRGKKTLPQATIRSKEGRKENIKGAFIPKANVHGLTIVLVDDVITTGYTAQEAGKTLKSAGALQVYVFTLARGI